MHWPLFVRSMLLISLVCLLSSVVAAPGSEGRKPFRITDGDVPLNLSETADGTLISLNSGYGAQYLLAYDEVRKRVKERLDFKNLWYGLDYNQERSAFLASSGNDWVYVVPWTKGSFGEVRKITLPGCQLTAGVVWLGAMEAVVACNLNQRVFKFEVSTGKVLASAETGDYPYGVAMLPANQVAVSNWGQSSVTIFDATNLKLVRTIPVGSHPNTMLPFIRNHQLLVACSDSDSVSVIDLKTLREVRRLNLRLPGSNLGGAQPNALAFDAAHGRLYVALAGINALGVFALPKDDEGELRFKGIIPVGSYPTALTYSSGRHVLYIADARNSVIGPNSPSSGRETGDCWRRMDSGSLINYIACLVGGGIEAIPDATMQRLAKHMTSLAVQVYGSRRQPLSSEASSRIQYFSARLNSSAPIRHVIYVIKENRTYDQLLGDMSEGNGDASLALFGEPVTPNQHALSRQFILFDNFYVDGDVSADGHLWSTAAQATDYIEKLWPSAYSHRLLHYDIWGPDFQGDETHDQPIAGSVCGYIWDAAEKAGISYRDYGEHCDVEDKQHSGQSMCFLRGLQGHYDKLYPRMGQQFGELSDSARVAEFAREFREFEKNDNFPQLVVMTIPNDHTIGTKAGYFTPRTMIADNDFAVGRLVDLVSHSRFWSSTALFILEDDAQDGPDHVDAHRSLLLAVSPFTQVHKVEHTHFSTVSVLKTIEQILGLSSLTYFDDRAPTLLVDFDRQRHMEAYAAVKPSVPLDEKNAPNAPGAKQTAQWDFSHPDAAPEMELNRVIWKSVKGRDSEPPPSVFNVQARMGTEASP